MALWYLAPWNQVGSTSMLVEIGSSIFVRVLPFKTLKIGRTLLWNLEYAIPWRAVGILTLRSIENVCLFVINIRITIKEFWNSMVFLQVKETAWTNTYILMFTVTLYISGLCRVTSGTLCKHLKWEWVIKCSENFV